MFQYLKDEGYGFLIDGFHVKGQVIDSRGVSAWGYGGQTLERGDWKDGRPSEVPSDQVNAWKKQTVLCAHELPGTARHDPLGYLQNRTVDWLDHQLAARELLDLDVSNTHLVVEHEYPPARIQDKDKLAPILEGSIAFTRKIDEAAASMFALQQEVLREQGDSGSGRRPSAVPFVVRRVVSPGRSPRKLPFEGNRAEFFANWQFCALSHRFFEPSELIIPGGEGEVPNPKPRCAGTLPPTPTRGSGETASPQLCSRHALLNERGLSPTRQPPIAFVGKKGPLRLCGPSGVVTRLRA